jgi:hypothetical protein
MHGPSLMHYVPIWVSLLSKWLPAYPKIPDVDSIVI